MQIFFATSNTTVFARISTLGWDCAGVKVGEQNPLVEGARLCHCDQRKMPAQPHIAASLPNAKVNEIGMAEVSAVGNR